jgi:hypothetical protein
MFTHNPVGSCCTRPRFNFVGGNDDRAKSYTSSERPIFSTRKIQRNVVLAVSVFVALGVAYACAQLLLAN